MENNGNICFLGNNTKSKSGRDLRFFKTVTPSQVRCRMEHIPNAHHSSTKYLVYYLEKEKNLEPEFLRSNILLLQSLYYTSVSICDLILQEMQMDQQLHVKNRRW